MKSIISLLLFIQVSMVQYGQIIADHNVVDKFDQIPQYYINEVKKMWLVVAGESHSQAYRDGLTLLKSSFPAYAVNITESGTPAAYTTSNLRASRGTWGDFDNSSGWIYNYGEEDWWTNSTAISRTKAGISYCNSHNLTISAIGFGWCYDAMGGGPTSNADPVYGCRWWGSSGNGPNGSASWGLDAADYALTSNSVCLDTYLSATQDYINYCTANNIPTKVFFTTGPVDTWNGTYSDENMYQAHLKYERIRAYVKADASRILFDYADILCYDNGSGTPNTVTWNGKTYPRITPTNVTPEQTGHISNAGAIRLGKAMWWMLARMAGWDGTTTGVNDLNEDENSKVSIERTSGGITLRFKESFIRATVRLIDLNGKLVSSMNVNKDIYTLNISSLPAGIYFVVISTSNSQKTEKIVIF